jgi:uncharacterized protein YggE
MKYRTSLASAVFAGILLAGSAFAEAALAETELSKTDLAPALTVNGEASVSAPPDEAQIEAGVGSDGKTAREATDSNNTAMGKVLLAMKAAGIDEKDIQTSQLSLQPQYAPNRTGPSPVVGYRASNRITVKLHDVLKVAGVIDMLVGAGANEISGIAFSVSNASKLLDDARERAVADARRKAEIYAKAAGVTLGAPLAIAEEGASGPVPYRKMSVGFAAATPIVPGEQTLRVAVSVTWAIKPAQ